MNSMTTILLAAGLLATPSTAQLETSAADGFVSINEPLLPLPPDKTWAAVTGWSQ